MGYNSKEEVKRELDSTKQKITDAQNKQARLKTARGNMENVAGDIKQLNKNLEDWKTSLNKVFGSFSWEGTLVSETQTIAGEAITEFKSYKAVHTRRTEEVTREIARVGLALDDLESTKNRLDYLYRTWTDD